MSNAVLRYERDLKSDLGMIRGYQAWNPFITSRVHRVHWNYDACIFARLATQIKIIQLANNTQAVLSRNATCFP